MSLVFEGILDLTIEDYCDDEWSMSLVFEGILDLLNMEGSC